ncbi:MAG: hypothetical protein CfClM3_0458 [Methanobrevibacter sp. CfCl-M3]
MLNLKSLMILAILAIGCSAVGLNNISAADLDKVTTLNKVITLKVNDTYNVPCFVRPIGNALKYVSISPGAGSGYVLTGIKPTPVNTTAKFITIHDCILKVIVVPKLWS